MERIAFWSPLASIVAIASHFSRLLAGAFKRDAIPKSAGTGKKSALFSKPKISQERRTNIKLINNLLRQMSNYGT